MKKTSRRNFGKQLTAAMAALPLANLATNVSSNDSEPQKTSAVNNNRNEHDTPPPVLIGSGSLLFEARTEANHDWTTTTPTTLGGKAARSHAFPAYDNAGAVATGDIHIAHIKIVDGSGEIIYRLDNDDKQDIITITAYMDGGKSELATLTTNQRSFVITFLADKKLENKATDPSMDTDDDPKTKRQRARYKDSGGGAEKEIYGIEVSSVKLGPLYSLKLQGHKGRKELRVMSWWEV